MKFSIRWKLVFMYVVLVLIAMIAAGTIIVLMIRNSEETELTLSAKRSIDVVRTSFLSSDTGDDIDTFMEKLYGDKSLEFYNTKIFILDNDANVIYPKKYYEQGKRITTHQIIGAIEDGYFSDPDKNIYLDGDDKIYLGIAENIKVDDSVKYIIYAIVDSTDIDVKVMNTVKIMLVALLASLFIAIVGAYFFSKFITKPILALTDSARYLADGTLKGNIEVYSNDEIGQLTETFNSMAQSLNRNINKISTEKNKLQTVFEHMTDGILVFDKDGKLLHYNKATSYMLHMDSNSSFSDTLAPSLKEDYAKIRDLVEQGTVVRTMGLDDKYFDLYFAKFKEDDTAEAGLMCVMQDVTENKRMEKLQKEFVANVSHELRTPITTIKTYSETLIDSFEHESEHEVNFLNTINKESDRMTNIVADLLSLAKLDNNKDELVLSRVDLVSLVGGVYDNFSLIAKNAGKIISFEKPDEQYIIDIDVEKIEQVVKNIVSNALKYTGDDGNIKIAMNKDENSFYVEVSDNGFGIPKEDLPRIFERFYRVDKTRSREMGGTGLGLSIAKGLMKLHGGDIVVFSKQQSGSTFTLVFPRK